MSNKDLIKKIADRIVDGRDTEWEMNIEAFDWNPGVGLYGIWRAYEATGELRYLDFLLRWAEAHGEEAGQKRSINSAAPCLTLWEVYKCTGKEFLKQVCLDTIRYLTKEAPLTVDGGLEHTVTEDVPGMKEQMWADTLFMACILLARTGRDLHRPEWCEFAAKQLVLHYEMLWDDKSELFFHGWHGIRKDHMSGVHWGRANAWILISTLEILETLGAFAGRAAVIERMGRHLNRLCRCQRENGMFGTILDDKSSCDEVSASAGIACGLHMAARTWGEAGELFTASERTIRAISGYVNEDGSVTKVSTGTPIMKDAQAYKEIAMTTTLYGQALAIMALEEGMKA